VQTHCLFVMTKTEIYCLGLMAARCVVISSHVLPDVDWVRRVLCDAGC
jgi:hypothetical protein